MIEKSIYTIGYESSSIEDFILTLKKTSISMVVDVRDYPLSRKKGFSKNILKNILADNNIEYIHLKGLGDPKEGRDAARNGNQSLFLKIFNAHLNSKIAKDHLQQAVDLSKENIICLLCYERNPEMCHRTIVAEAISKINGYKIRPIGVQISKIKNSKVKNSINAPAYA